MEVAQGREGIGKCRGDTNKLEVRIQLASTNSAFVVRCVDVEQDGDLDVLGDRNIMKAQLCASDGTNLRWKYRATSP